MRVTIAFGLLVLALTLGCGGEPTSHISPVPESAVEGKHLNYSGLDAKALGEVIAGPLASAGSLKLSGGSLGDEGVALLAAADAASGLNALWLEQVGMTGRGVEALATSATLRPRELYLTGNSVDGAGVARLAASPVAEGLEVLRLSLNPVGDAGAKVLAQAESLGALKRLGLAMASIEDVGAKALLASRSLKGLEMLDLSLNDLSARSLLAVTEPGALPALEELIVSRAAIDDETKAAIATKRPGLELSVE